MNLNNVNIKDLDSEELYQLIKSKIKQQNENSHIKKTTTQDYTYTQDEIYCAKKCINFDNNSLNNWLSSPFDTYSNEKNILSPQIKGKWGSGMTVQKRTGTEICNLIFRSNEDINYKIVNNTLKSTVVLKGESDFWIFLHCKEKFDDETIVILFSKIEFSEVVNMSLGLFIKTNDGNNDIDDDYNDNKFSFRIFHTMQLIKSYNTNPNASINSKYENSDSCMVKIIVIDEGNEYIKVSAWVNEGDAENHLNGNFCKQVIFNDSQDKIKNSSNFDLNNKNYKVMIAGSGAHCKITHFSCETNFKDNIDYVNGCKQGFNSCNCCLIF